MIPLPHGNENTRTIDRPWRKAAQIDHPQDMLRRVGDARDCLVTANFLHLQEVDRIVLGAERKGELLALGVRGVMVLGLHRRLHGR